MSTEVAQEHGTKLYVTIWIYLLALTAFEVVLAYVHFFTPTHMLVILMVLSIVKAGLIMSYFMHLRFEKTSLILSLVPAVVVVIALLFVFFPDGFRVLELRVH
jgi:cytochrome c oxidase subunit IV